MPVPLALGPLDVEAAHVDRGEPGVLDLELAAHGEQRLRVAALLRFARCN